MVYYHVYHKEIPSTGYYGTMGFKTKIHFAIYKFLTRGKYVFEKIDTKGGAE